MEVIAASVVAALAALGGALGGQWLAARTARDVVRETSRQAALGVLREHRAERVRALLAKLDEMSESFGTLARIRAGTAGSREVDQLTPQQLDLVNAFNEGIWSVQARIPIPAVPFWDRLLAASSKHLHAITDEDEEEEKKAVGETQGALIHLRGMLEEWVAFGPTMLAAPE